MKILFNSLYIWSFIFFPLLASKTPDGPSQPAPVCGAGWFLFARLGAARGSGRWYGRPAAAGPSEQQQQWWRQLLLHVCPVQQSDGTVRQENNILGRRLQAATFIRCIKNCKVPIFSGFVRFLFFYRQSLVCFFDDDVDSAWDSLVVGIPSIIIKRAAAQLEHWCARECPRASTFTLHTPVGLPHRPYAW